MFIGCLGFLVLWLLCWFCWCRNWVWLLSVFWYIVCFCGSVGVCSVVVCCLLLLLVVLVVCLGSWIVGYWLLLWRWWLLDVGWFCCWWCVGLVCSFLVVGLWWILCLLGLVVWDWSFVFVLVWLLWLWWCWWLYLGRGWSWLDWWLGWLIGLVWVLLVIVWLCILCLVWLLLGIGCGWMYWVFYLICVLGWWWW